MGPDDLSESEVDLIGQCLRAVADGPFFPDWEIQTLIGIDRSTVSEVANVWPSASDGTRRDLAVGNVLNNLIGYPIDHEHEWAAFISYDRDEVRSTLDRWKSGARPKHEY
jgi:hypothetical protein